MATSTLSRQVNTLHANERVSPTDFSEMSMSAIGSMETMAGGKEGGEGEYYATKKKEGSGRQAGREGEREIEGGGGE